MTAKAKLLPVKTGQRSTTANQRRPLESRPLLAIQIDNDVKIQTL